MTYIKKTLLFLLIMLFITNEYSFCQKVRYVDYKFSKKATLENSISNNGFYVREIFAKKNLIKVNYFNKDSILEIRGTTDTFGNYIGKWEEYSNDGKCLYTLNIDKSQWKVYDKKIYPYKNYFDKAKKISDSLLISFYGKRFFKKNIRWSPFGSTSYKENQNYNCDWVNPCISKPIFFLIKYKVEFFKDCIQDNLIELNLDTIGNIIFPLGLYSEIKGFDKNFDKNFRFNINKAISIAAEKGLSQSNVDSIKTIFVWEYYQEQRREKFNGEFRCLIASKTESINDTFYGKPIIVDSYDVYVFNPWTSAFVEKRKMERIRDSFEDNKTTIFRLSQKKIK